MNEHFFIDEPTIQRLASPQIYRRGDQYEHNGAVLMVLQRGNVLQADVQGCEDEPYCVQVRFGASSISHASCTCPYDHGGICKHIVAALLAAVRHPELIAYQPPVEARLEELSREQLQSLLLDVVEAYPETAALVDRFIALPHSDHPTGQLLDVDVWAIRQEVRQILGDNDAELDPHGMLEDLEDSTLAPPIMHLVSPVTEYLRANRAAEARIVLEAITDECMVYWANRPITVLYDHETAILKELATFWVTAILFEPVESRLTTLLERWIADFNERFGLPQSPFETVLLALETDWEAPMMYDLWRNQVPSQLKLTPRELELVPYRLEVLALQGKFIAYKALALAAGRHIDYAVRLLIDGDAAAALDHGYRHLKTADQAYEFALELWSQQRHDHAVAFAEHSLTLPIALNRWGEPSVTLAQVSRTIRDWHIALGHDQQARAAALEVVMRQLTLVDYQCLVRIFGPLWLEQRTAILQRLAQRDNALNAQTLIGILLDEHENTKALALAKQYGVVGDLLHRVVKAAVVIEPAWAIKIANAESEAAIAYGPSYYAVAAQWLALMRDALISSNQEAEWAAHYATLCERHKRKYRLLEALRPLME